MRFISELHALSFNDARHSDACSMVLPWIQGKCKDQGLQASTSEYLEQSCPPSRLICCQRAFSYWAPLDVIKDFEVAKPFCFPSSSHVLILCRYLLVFFESARSNYLHDRSLAPGHLWLPGYQRSQVLALCWSLFFKSSRSQPG